MATTFDFDLPLDDVPEGFSHAPGYLDARAQSAVLDDVRTVIKEAPLFTPSMPRTGRPLSVRMTNCGALGWVTDKDEGYRYQAMHPVTRLPWPAIPDRLMTIWTALAPDAPPPEACLVNWYEPSAKMGLHVDRDEVDQETPVVSLSLGDDAWFRIGGKKRGDKTVRLRVRSGDAIVLGGDARLCYHGVDRILAGTGDLLEQPGRVNLTLRRVTRSE